MQIAYNLGIILLDLFYRLASLVHPKARAWVKGRRNWAFKLEHHISPGDHWYWFHAASLGEFEQGRNLIESIKASYPEVKILLTFFSPSGYEVRKNYSYADCVLYLPMDHPATVKRFLDILQPRLVFFIKYEFWLNYLKELHSRNIPSLLISASLKPGNSYFRFPFGKLYIQAFQSFKAIFTQNEYTARLLEQQLNSSHIIRSSDTRYDRVMTNRESFRPIPEVSAFRGDRFCLIAGSCWPVGEKILFEAWEEVSEELDMCMILAPHEIHADHIQTWIDRYPESSIRFSEIDQLRDHHRILWIDNIGMLSRLYYYAQLSYIGGGFKGQLHNILEAAAFGSTVCFGPKYQAFPEAGEMLNEGSAFSFENSGRLIQGLRELHAQPDQRERQEQKNRRFINSRIGASSQIMNWCAKQALFT